MRSHLASLSSFLVASALFLACSNEDSGKSGSATGPVSAADFPARYVTTYCATVAPCCQAAGIPYDDAYCHEKNAFNPDKFGALVAGPSTAFDPAAAGRCLDAIAAAGCDAKDDLDQAGCEGVIVGQLALGATCYDDLQCAPVAGKKVGCGLVQSEDGPGECAVYVEAAPLAAPCGRQVYGTCAPGLTCADAGASQSTCVAAPGLGEPCVPGGSCNEGAICHSGAGASFTCQAISPDGGPCTSFVDCVEASFCTAAGTCERRHDNGAACVSSEECASYRCQAGTCRPTTASSCRASDAPAPTPTGGAGPAFP